MGRHCGSYQLFIDFRKAYNSVRREVLHNILIEFSIPMYGTSKANKNVSK
jgi:hypothetical protein